MVYNDEARGLYVLNNEVIALPTENNNVDNILVSQML